MKICALVICLVAAGAVVRGDDEPGLVKKFMKAAKSCKKEAGEGLKLGDCFKSYAEGGDMTTPEINQCKCAIACIAEKFRTVNTDLSWKWDKLKAINEEIKSFNEDLYGEGLEIIKQCEEKVGGASEKCDATFKLFECAMDTSEMTKKVAEKIANKLQ